MAGWTYLCGWLWLMGLFDMPSAIPMFLFGLGTNVASSLDTKGELQQFMFVESAICFQFGFLHL